MRSGNRSMIFLAFIAGVFNSVFAQNSLNSGDFVGGTWGTGQAMSASAGGSLIITKTVATLGDKYFRFYGDGSPCGEYQPDVNGDFFTHNVAITLPNGNCGSTNAWRINVPTLASNVVFKTDGGNDGMDRSIAYVIQGAVRTVNTVAQAPVAASVFPGQAVTVTATLSGAFATGQAAYLRYSTDNFATSTVVAMTGASPAVSIPAIVNKPGTVVRYYVFTSGNTAPAANGSDADFSTINLNDNGGLFYSYTVSSGWTTAAAGNWGTAATWTANAVPPTITNLGVVTINHSVTQNTAALVSGVLVNATGTLTATANTLTISNNTSGTTFTNSGTLALSGTHAIAFAGTGTHTVSGTSAFNNVITTTGVNFGSASTINGNFTINAGGFVSTNAPTYGAASTLTYNTAAAYTAGVEWTANALTGQGVPQNVSITTASTSVNFGASTQYRRLRGNLNIAASTTLALSTASGGDLRIGGNWTNAGTFTANSRAVFFDGSAAQSIASGGLSFAFLFISNTPATVTAATAVTVSGGLTIDANARFNMAALTLTIPSSGNTVNGFLRTAGTITGATAASLTFSSTGTFEHNSTTTSVTIPLATWQAGSTLAFIGYTTATVAPTNLNQAFSNVVYNCTAQTATMNFTGNLPNVGGNFSILSTGTTGILRLTGTVALNMNIAGNFSISAGTLDVVSSTGATTINIGGNFTQSGGTISKSGTATLNFTFNKSTGIQTITQSAGTITAAANWNAGNGTSTNTVQLASNLNLGTGTGTFAVANNASLDFQNFVLSGSGGFTPATGSTLISANANGINTSGATGSVQTTTRTFTATGVGYSYNGSSVQAAGTAPGAAVSISNLTLNNSAGLSLNSDIASLSGTLTLTSGNIRLGSFNLGIGVTGVINGGSASRYIITNGSGQLRKASLSATFTFPVGNSSFNPVTLSNSGTPDQFSVRVLDTTGTPPANNPSMIVNRYWEISESVSGGSSLSITAQYNNNEWNSDAFKNSTDLKMGFHDGSEWYIFPAIGNGSGSGPFSAGFSDFGPTVATYVVGIGKEDGLGVPPVDFTWTGSTSSDWGTSSNWDLGIVPASTDNISIPAASSYNHRLAITGNRSCLAFTVNGNGTFTMEDSSSLHIKRDFTYSSSAEPIFSCSSSLRISTSGPQTIPSFSYGNLNIAGGSRVLASSGTINICGAFTPSASQTVTGSTINFNGNSAQTIPAISYHNLNVSNSRNGSAISLPSGTISVAGTFDVSGLSNYTASVNAASIFDFTSASAQTIPAFFYGQLNNSGNGPRTWASSGIIDISQRFSPGTGTHTITGSTIRYSNTAATTISLTSFTTNIASRQYNNLTIAGGASTTWQMPGLTLGITGDLSISSGTLRLANGVTTTNNATFNVDGNLSISGGALDIAGGTTAIGTLNLSGDFSQTGGAISRSATTSTTSSFNFVKSSGIQLISQAGGTLTLTGFAFNIGNATSTNTVRLNSNLAIGGTPGTSPAGFVRVQALAKLDFQTYNISGTGGFTTVANSTLITANTDPAGALNAHPATRGSLQNGLSSAQRVFSTTANYIYNGSSDQFIGNGLSTVNNLTIATSGGAKVILNLSSGTTSITVTNRLTLTSGILVLNSGMMFVYSDVQGAPFGPSNMIVSNEGSVFPQRNPGRFNRYFPTALVGTTQNVSMLFPIGDLRDTPDYTPVLVNLSYTAGSSTVATPYFGVKCIDRRNPYDASLTNYLSRYWIVTSGTAFNNASSASLNLKLCYKNSDVEGDEALLNLSTFSTSTLQTSEVSASSPDILNDTIYASLNDKSLFTDHDFFVRKTVPAYFRSNGNGKWQDVNNWLVSSDINFVSPPGMVPPIAPNAGCSDSIRILAAHSITADSTFPPYTMDQALIEGTLNVATGSTMAITNGPSSIDVRVSGTFSVAGTQTQLAGSAISFENSGIYIHATPTLNAKIPAASWLSGSECRITGITSSLPDLTTLNQVFSDFTWDCPGQTASLNLAGLLTGVARDLKIQNTGGFTLGLVASTGSGNLFVGRNLEISGGNLVLSTGAISPFVTVNGDLSISDGVLDLNSGSSNISNLNLSGNLNQTGGIIRRTTGAASNLNFVRNSGIQTISQTGGSISSAVNLNIGDGAVTNNTVRLNTGFVNGTGTVSSKSGATLDFQTNAISGGGIFSAAAGTTLKTANTDTVGCFVTAPTAAGCIQTPTRLFSNSGINFSFNGSSSQICGDALGAIAINNLEIDNESGISLSVPVVINGMTSFTNGKIKIADLDATLGSAATFSGQGSGRYFQTSGSGRLVRTVGNSSALYPVGNTSYNPFQISGSGSPELIGVQVVDTPENSSVNDAGYVVNRFWKVSRLNQGTGTLAVSAQFNQGEEGAYFGTSSDSKMGFYSYNTSSWQTQPATFSGQGPYVLSSSYSQPDSPEFLVGLGREDAFVCASPSPLWVLDADNDGHILDSLKSCTRPGPGYRKGSFIGIGDCDDANPAVWRTGLFFADSDGDQYGAGSAVSLCFGLTAPAGYSVSILGEDCNDNLASVNPGMTETCNGLDDNCDGLIDNGAVLPQLPLVSGVSRCGTGSVTLNASVSSGTVNWYDAPVGGNLLGTGLVLETPVLSASVSYYAEAVIPGSNCVSEARSVAQVVINPIPAVVSVVSGTRCGPGTVSLSAVSSSGTVDWYDAASGGNLLGTGDGFTTPVISATRVYYAEALSSVCSSAVRTAVTATVLNDLVTATVSGNRCISSGQSTTLTAGGGTQYVWSTGSTDQSVTVSPLVTTTYSVTVSNSSGCSSEATVTVNVDAFPAVSISGNPTICLGQSTTLTVDMATSYLWSTGSTAQSVTVNPVSTTTYSVTVTNLSGCSSTASREVVVNPTSSVSVNVKRCPGTLYQLPDGQQTGSSGIYTSVLQNRFGCDSVITTNLSFADNVAPLATECPSSFTTCNPVSWTPPVFTDNCSFTVTSNYQPGSVLPLGITTVTYTATDAGGNTTICSFLVTVVDFTLSTTQTNVGCFGQSTGSSTVSASGTAGLVTYLWSNGVTGPTISNVPAGTYTVTVTNASCSKQTSVTITQPSQFTTTVTASGPTNFCQGGSVTLTAGTASGYLWNTGATTQSIVVTAPGNYFVTATNASGCSFTTESMTITINPVVTPVITAGGPLSICTGSSVTLTSSSATGNLWSNGATTQSITVTSSGSYTVTVTSSGCSASSAATEVVVNPLPALFELSGGGNYCSSGGPSGISLTLSGSQSGVTYQFRSTAGTVIAILAGTGSSLTVSDVIGTADYQVRAVNSTTLCELLMTGTISVTAQSAPTWYKDNDLDGYGDVSNSVVACQQPEGYVIQSGDCDDSQAEVNPGAAEICGNGIDDNCNGEVDRDCNSSFTYYQDADGDNFGNSLETISSPESIPPAGYTVVGGDCNEENPAVYPGAIEQCNGIDDNCDGIVDEGCQQYTYYADADGDTYGNSGSPLVSILPTPPAGYVENSSDCNDTSASVYPGAPEICNGVDDNCDGTVDNGVPVLSAPTQINGPAGVCRNSVNQVFTVPLISGATSYVWTLPGGATGSSTTNSITLSFSSSYVTGSLCVRAVNSCGQSPALCRSVAYLSTAPGTPGTISGQASAVCSTFTQTYSVAAVTNATTYTWTAPANSIIISGQGSNQVVVQFSAGFTTGNLSVIAGNCIGNSATRTLSLTRLPATPTSISGPINAVCPGSTQTYSTPVIVGATSYTWTVPSGAVINSGQGSSSITVTFPTPFTSGSVTVRSATACTTSAARSVTVNSVPVAPASISGVSVGVCGGSTQTYTCPASTSASSYTWTVPTGALINSGQGTTSVSVTFPAGFATGNISVTARNTCGSSTARTLAVRSATAQPGTISGTSTNLCGGGTFSYSIAAVAGASSYSWTAPAGCSISGSGSGTSVILVVPSGFVSGTLSVVANNACGASATRTLTLSALPSAPTTLTGPAPVCPTATGLIYSTTAVTGASTYTWTVPTGASIIAGAGTSSITVNWGTVAGSVTVKAGNSCGTNATAKTLAVALVACRTAGEEASDEIVLTPEVLIYPNPGRDKFHLQTQGIEGVQLDVRDVLGREVLRQEIKGGEISVDLGSKPFGTYFFHIRGLGFSKVVKVVKE